MKPSEILVIDDDLADFRPGLEQALRGHRMRFAYTGGEGLRELANNAQIALVLLDIKMPQEFATNAMREGIEVLKRIKAEQPRVPVIMLTVLNEIDLVVEAIQLGAFHYITKPIDRDKLRDAVARALENTQLKTEVANLRRARDAVLQVNAAPAAKGGHFHGLIGQHPLMRALYARVERAARFDDMSVVLLGESGSGKDLVAHAIHACSPRARGPFVAVNCGGLPESVLESVLFGHAEGAFTDARAAREGLFQRSHGGTLFLDEIGDMPHALQVKILRAIENGEITPVGGAPVPVDVRIVCATHRDLTQLRDEGTFREDLFYRIWDIPLALPTLRDRKEDIPLLAAHFLAACRAKNGIACAIDEPAVAALAEYDWPGNVRELSSVLRRMAVFAERGRITAEQTRECLRLGPSPEKPALPTTPDVDTPHPLPHSAVPEEEAYPEIADPTEYCRLYGEIALTGHLQRAVAETGNIREAMALLGTPESKYDAFRKWMQRLKVKARKR